MDRTNTELEEVNKLRRMEILVDYIIDNAPDEALVDFSKQFLTRDFKSDEKKFESSCEMYEEYMESKQEPTKEGKIISFPQPEEN